MSKRKSWKVQARIYKSITNEHRSAPIQVVRDESHLTMTDAEIDADPRYAFPMGKADRTRMKKEAAKHRAQLAIKEILDAERLGS